jgi:hypothetical protein
VIKKFVTVEQEELFQEIMEISIDLKVVFAVVAPFGERQASSA